LQPVAAMRERRSPPWARPTGIRNRLLLALLVIAFGARCSSGISEDEFKCELAIAHLDECCPRFQSDAVSCRTTPMDKGCGGFSSLPLLDRAEAECVSGLDCQDVRDMRLCEKIAALHPAADRCDAQDDCADGGYYRPDVCP
jgi:hypothetical protein